MSALDIAEFSGPPQRLIPTNHTGPAGAGPLQRRVRPGSGATR